jgi:hypothetical protein
MIAEVSGVPSDDLDTAFDSTSPAAPIVNAMSDKQKQQMIGGVVGGTVGVVTVGLLGGLLGGLLTTSTTGAPMLPPTTAVPTTTSTMVPVFDERMLGGPQGSVSAWGAWVGSGASDLTESVSLGAHGQDALGGSSARIWWIVAGAALVCCLAVAALLSLGVDRSKRRRARRREGRGMALSEGSDDEQSWPPSPVTDNSPASSPDAATALLLVEDDVPEVRAFEDSYGVGDSSPRGVGASRRLKCLRPWGLPKLQPFQKQHSSGLASPRQSMLILSPTRASLQASRSSLHSTTSAQYAVAPQRLSSSSVGRLPSAPWHPALGSEPAAVRRLPSTPGTRPAASLPAGVPSRTSRGQPWYHP